VGNRRFEVDAADPGWIGASFEALGDGAVELGVAGALHICLGFLDNAIGIVCDGCISLFLASEGPLGDDTASNGWYI